MAGNGMPAVKPATRDAIVSEVERAFVLAGARDYDHGVEIFRKLLDWIETHHRPMRSKADFAAFLDSMPEPSWWRRRFILGTLRSLPQLMSFGLHRLASKAQEDFPAHLVGRPGLDAISKAKIVAYIGNRHIRGYTLDQAKESARIRFNISKSSVQRVWDDRGNTTDVDFRSVLKFIEEDTKDRSECLEWMDRQP